MVKHRNDYKYQLSCPHCDYKTKASAGSSKNRLKSHIQLKHENNSYACKKCHFETKVESYLYDHTYRQHNTKIFTCKICQNVYRYKQLLLNTYRQNTMMQLFFVINVTTEHQSREE